MFCDILVFVRQMAIAMDPSKVVTWLCFYSICQAVSYEIFIFMASILRLTGRRHEGLFSAVDCVSLRCDNPVLQRVRGRWREEVTAGGQNWVSRFVLSTDGASTGAGRGM